MFGSQNEMQMLAISCGGGGLIAVFVKLADSFMNPDFA